MESYAVQYRRTVKFTFSYSNILTIERYSNPIDSSSNLRLSESNFQHNAYLLRNPNAANLPPSHGNLFYSDEIIFDNENRSEERRVGKECW